MFPLSFGLYRNFYLEPRYPFGVGILILFVLTLYLYVYDKRAGSSDQLKQRLIGVLFTVLAFGFTFRNQSIEMGLVALAPVTAVLMIDQETERARFQIPLLIALLFTFSYFLGFFSNQAPSLVLTKFSLACFSMGVLAYYIHYVLKLSKESLRTVHNQSSKLHSQARHLKQVSRTDDLTGLLNRRAAMSTLALAVSDRRMKGNDSCLAFVDIDHFKQINDEYGHAAGDDILKAFAVLGEELIRENDMLARWGGEEFLLFLPDTDPTGATIICERIRAAVEETEFKLQGDSEYLRVSVSIGIASLQQSEHTIGETIRCADAAMYHIRRKIVAVTES